ncbi:predicted protein [Histoplasma mississippiense (nom. inval.)]|uniref:predicted protein n=1 Tax=Ajellomyces capsulatus (strain NAm1 / WU24) TaxID=2059318 RepID=UPI000157CA0A|nr:predicted protein [Histoplasma mississippiense (nom. inval.)]EDN09495.1 predicted protein [Histoplasma mississippiense (nom. inval.)]
MKDTAAFDAYELSLTSFLTLHIHIIPHILSLIDIRPLHIIIAIVYVEIRGIINAKSAFTVPDLNACN